MKRLLLAAAIAVLPFTAHARWYTGHLGPEICVPVDDIGSNLERLYYGSGSMHTPEDFLRMLQRVGGVLKHTERMPFGANNAVIYEVVNPLNGRSTAFMFFDDRTLCEAAMSVVEGSR